MTKSTTIHRVLNRNQVEEYVGGRPNLQRLLKAGWIKPIAGKERPQYDLRAVDRALDKLSAEGWSALAGAEAES